MAKKKAPLERFSDLTWNDIEEWAGEEIVLRGERYQTQGRVVNLAVTDDGCLIANVEGSKRYATRVAILEKKPDQVVRWYDKHSNNYFGWL